MTPKGLKELLEQLQSQELSVDQAYQALQSLPYQSVGDMARIDHHRELRNGSPEVVYGESKSAEQIAGVMQALAKHGGGALATRVSPDKAEAAMELMGKGNYDAMSRTLIITPTKKREPGKGDVAVVCAGTSDLPIAEECALSLEFLGHAVQRVTDVGVAGLHRMLDVVPILQRCEVVIVVAGMEGALPTAVAGMIDRPVIAVPTSVGYGVSAGGFAALLGMLSSCAPGVTVVNIDNGLGAALAATRINRVRA